MELPPMHAEVERLGLSDLVADVRRRLAEGAGFSLDAVQEVLASTSNLTEDQNRFLLINGLDAIVGALDEEGFEFQRSHLETA